MSMKRELELELWKSTHRLPHLHRLMHSSWERNVYKAHPDYVMGGAFVNPSEQVTVYFFVQYMAAMFCYAPTRAE